MRQPPDIRRVQGRLLRRSVPRSVHADWDPPAGRRDPVEILETQAATRVRELGPIRYQRMSESPFAFFRGGAAVMSLDLSATPTTGIYVQACGDAHVNNFGFFGSPERNLVFDINDFDETLPGPWEWDVKRLCTSLFIVARQRGWSTEDGEVLVAAAARTYRHRIADYSSWHTLDLFYERTEIKRVIEHFPLKHRAGVHRDVKRARRKDHLRAVAKLTSVAEGQRRFVDDPPLIVHLDATDHDLDEAQGLIESYRSSLPDERRSLFDRYRLVDVSRKVVGVGSVGTRCWIALMAGPDDPDADFVVLQAKEAQPSVLEPYAGQSTQGHHGKRVVVGQRRIQAASDIFLGWAEGPKSGRNYYIRQLWDYKGQGDPMTMSRTNLVHYGELCAWILARSHARTGDAIAIAAYLGKSTTFDRAIATFAGRYARTNEADYAALVEAIETGRIEAAR